MKKQTKWILLTLLISSGAHSYEYIGPEGELKKRVVQNIIRWNEKDSPIKLTNFKCKPNEMILIKGDVEIMHPKEKYFDHNAKHIKVQCDYLKFEKDATLNTRSNLKMLISENVEGNLLVHSSRGIKGENATEIEGYDSIRKEKNGAHGKKGRSGKNASGDLCSMGVECSEAKSGGKGHEGEVGENGLSGAKGNNGKRGANASNIKIIIGSLSKNAEVLITAQGGEGGAGGLGQRGEDGGNGGNGGKGGNGGHGKGLKRPRPGGTGGKGGDGGNGGNGGPGGDGGDGGNGGHVTFYVKNNGEFSSFPDVINDGGAGGIPGLGGAGGKGGKGGIGGKGGSGGRPPRDIVTDCHTQNCDADNGKKGDDGKNGEDGLAGPLGRFGADGQAGENRSVEYGRLFSHEAGYNNIM